MRGTYGTSMTVVRIRRRPRPLERAPRLCPACYSLAGEPCRKILSQPGAKKLKLGGPIARIHPQRRAGNTTSAADQYRPAQARRAGRGRRTAPRPPAQTATVAHREPPPERIDPASGKRVVSAFEAVRREYGGRRTLRVDNGY